MRYLIQADRQGNLILSKLKTSKNNSTSHYKTRRIALKHMKQIQIASLFNSYMDAYREELLRNA